MEAMARTPEELESLFEDAFVIRDREAVAGLFEDRAVLVVAEGPPESRGSEEIAISATVMWDSGRAYVADPRRVVQVRDIALVVGDHGINVARRGRDGAWRYAISVLSVEQSTFEEER